MCPRNPKQKHGRAGKTKIDAPTDTRKTIATETMLDLSRAQTDANNNIRRRVHTSHNEVYRGGSSRVVWDEWSSQHVHQFTTIFMFCCFLISFLRFYFWANFVVEMKRVVRTVQTRIFYEYLDLGHTILLISSIDGADQDTQTYVSAFARHRFRTWLKMLLTNTTFIYK
jgi:hypothetical protein